MATGSSIQIEILTDKIEFKRVIAAMSFAHLRTLYRFEQSRLLPWQKKIILDKCTRLIAELECDLDEMRKSSQVS